MWPWRLDLRVVMYCCGVKLGREKCESEKQEQRLSDRNSQGSFNEAVLLTVSLASDCELDHTSAQSDTLE